MRVELAQIRQGGTKKRKKYLHFYWWWYSKYSKYFYSLGNRTPTPSPGPSYWGDPRYSASQVNFSFDNKVAFIFKEFNLKAAELQSALASLPKSFSSQLSQYAQYSNLQQVYLCSRVWFPYFVAKLVLSLPLHILFNFELNFPWHRNVPRSDPFFTSCSVCRIRTRTADGFIPTTVERTSYRKVNRAPRRSTIDLFQIGIKSHHEIIKENSSPPHALTRALVASMDRLPCLVSDFQKIYTVSSVRCPLPMYLKWPCNIQYKK